jgi:hypothetical protein
VPDEIDERPGDVIAPGRVTVAQPGLANRSGYAEPVSKRLLELARRSWPLLKQVQDGLMQVGPGRERDHADVGLGQLGIDGRDIIEIGVGRCGSGRRRPAPIPAAQRSGELQQRFVAPRIHREVRDRDDETHIVPLVGLVPVDPVEAWREWSLGCAVTDDLQVEGHARDGAAPAACGPGRDEVFHRDARLGTSEAISRVRRLDENPRPLRQFITVRWFDRHGDATSPWRVSQINAEGPVKNCTKQCFQPRRGPSDQRSGQML